jgi:multicomponent Na+:H+ antiporter subunit E
MITRTLALVTIWVALWGELSIANVATGLVLAALLSVPFTAARSATHRVHPWAALRLAASVLSNLVVSSWTVVIAVLRPNADRIHAEIMTVQLETRSPLVASVIANSITLTPGTMTVGCDRRTFVLRVHVLGRVDPDHFVRNVRQLERRVTAAISFTPPVPERDAT